MARYLTSKTLIDSATRRAMIPKSQVTFTEEDFLAFANEEMDTAVIPYVMSFHEDYFLFDENVPLQKGVSQYAIPYRAAGNKLRDVAFQDTGNNIFEMTRILVEDISFYQHNGNTGSNSPLRAFYIKNNDVCLMPEIGLDIQGHIRMYYYIRPSALVSEDRAMIVQAIDTVTGQVTVDKIPTIFGINTLVDFIKVKSPHKCMSIDKAITNVDTVNNIISFSTTDLPSKLVVGDHICVAEECIIPQIPTDLHSLLSQRMACRCLEALGDQQGLAAANAKLTEMELKLGTVVDDRVEGSAIKVVNRHTALRNARNYYRR
jgi:hypothetical protein